MATAKKPKPQLEMLVWSHAHGFSRTSCERNHHVNHTGDEQQKIKLVPVVPPVVAPTKPTKLCKIAVCGAQKCATLENEALSSQ